MWSGGKLMNVPTDAAGVEDVRNLGLEHAEEGTELQADMSDARAEMERSQDDKTEASIEERHVRGDKDTAEGEVRQETQRVRNAEDSKANNDHQNKEQRMQLDQAWREWESSKDLAETMAANFERRLYSFISREVAAFLDEDRQRRGAIALVVDAAGRKLRAAGNADVSKSAPQGSTQLDFKIYTNLTDLPQNDSLSQLASVRAEYDKLIERGKTLAEREGDPFYTDKLNEAVAELNAKKSELDKAITDYAVAQRASNTADATYESARVAYNDALDDYNENTYEQNAAKAAIDQYDTNVRAEAMKKQKKS